jgi:hypothetical protein
VSTGCSAPTPNACQVGGGGGRVACVNFNTDPLNCGDCGSVCDPGQTCTDGNCRG